MTSSSQTSIGSRCCKSSTNCCKNLQNISLQDLKAELKKQFKYTWPSILYNFFNYSLILTTLLFCGRIGKLEFAAASLAGSVINSLCLSVARGLSTACDTFFAQMYGSSNKKHIGVVLQRSLIILTIFAFPVLATFPNMERILLAVNVKPDIARLTGSFVVYFMPAVPAVFCIEVFVKYLQNTNHVLPVVACTVGANGVCALLCYIFIFHLDMGISGPAISLMLTYFALLALLVGYIKFSKMYVDTWQGYSKECFYDWGSFISLSISGMMHICLEWWGFEIGYFLSGILGKTELGAYSVTIQFASLSYMIPLGVSIATSIRIGHSLGSKDSKSAKIALYVSLLCSWVCALFVCVLLLSTKDHLAKVFIDDPEIISLVSKVVPLCVVYSFFDFTGAVCNGGLRGTGHQKIGAIVGFICYYIISLPVGAYLMFKADLGIIGLWSGITLGLMAQGTSLLTYMMNLDWDLEVHKAQVRAGATEIRFLPNSSIPEETERTEKQRLNGEPSDQTRVDTNGTELRSLSTETPNHKLSADAEVTEQETKEALMKAELSNEKGDIETLPDEINIRLARDDIRFLVFKRFSLFLVFLTIFIVGLSLGILFKPSYCEQFDKYDANITLNIEYLNYDDDCIQL